MFLTELYNQYDLIKFNPVSVSKDLKLEFFLKKNRELKINKEYKTRIERVKYTTESGRISIEMLKREKRYVLNPLIKKEIELSGDIYLD